MVQLYIKISDTDGCADWAIVELQGDLETKSQAATLAGKFIGNLYFTHKDVPVLIVGHHILYGKVIDLDKPLMVMTKVPSDNLLNSSGNNSMDTSDHSGRTTEYQVKAVIRKKLLFKTRPKPIIANVPKKV